MGVLIPEGFGQAYFKMQLTGKPEPFVFTMGFQADTWAIAQAGWAEFVDEADIAGRLFAPASMATGYTFTGVDYTYMTETGPNVGTAAASYAGTDGGLPAPCNAALLVRKSTARGGRQGRGRMFLPPAFCGEAQIDGAGIINPANVATINGRLANLLGDIVAAGLAPVLLHSDADPPDAITSLSLAPLIATQRRRLR